MHDFLLEGKALLMAHRRCRRLESLRQRWARIRQGQADFSPAGEPSPPDSAPVSQQSSATRLSPDSRQAGSGQAGSLSARAAHDAEATAAFAALDDAREQLRPPSASRATAAGMHLQHDPVWQPFRFVFSSILALHASLSEILPYLRLISASSPGHFGIGMSCSLSPFQHGMCLGRLFMVGGKIILAIQAHRHPAENRAAATRTGRQGIRERVMLPSPESTSAQLSGAVPPVPSRALDMLHRHLVAKLFGEALCTGPPTARSKHADCRDASHAFNAAMLASLCLLSDFFLNPAFPLHRDGNWPVRQSQPQQRSGALLRAPRQTSGQTAPTSARASSTGHTPPMQLTPAPALSSAELGRADSGLRRQRPLSSGQAEGNRGSGRREGNSRGANSQLSNVPHRQQAGAHLATSGAAHMRWEPSQQRGQPYLQAAERREMPPERPYSHPQHSEPTQAVQHHAQCATGTARSSEQPMQAVAWPAHSRGAPLTPPFSRHAQAQQQVEQESWHQQQPDSMQPGMMPSCTPTPAHSSGGIRNQSPSSEALQQALPTFNDAAAKLASPQTKSGRQQPLSTADNQHRAAGVDPSSAAAPPVRGTLKKQRAPGVQAQSDKAALMEALQVVKPLLKGLYSQDLLSREQFKRAAERATRLLRERGQAGAHAAAAAVKEALSMMGLELAATRV